MPDVENVHATGLALGRRGILLCGKSGAGKSDLALRCITQGQLPVAAAPFRLVADDRVTITKTHHGIELGAPEVLHGLLEVRGVGITRLPSGLVVAPGERILLALVVELTTCPIERMPSAPPATVTIAGKEIRRIELSPFEASAPAKIALALAEGGDAS